MKQVTIAISSGADTDVLTVPVGETDGEKGAMLVLTATRRADGYAVELALGGDGNGIIAGLTAVFEKVPELAMQAAIAARERSLLC